MSTPRRGIIVYAAGLAPELVEDYPPHKKKRPWNQQLTHQPPIPRSPQGDSSYCQDRPILNGMVAARGYVKGTSRIAPLFGGAVGNRGLMKEYHLTLDMAKELSMVGRNGKIAASSFLFWKKT